MFFVTNINKVLNNRLVTTNQSAPLLSHTIPIATAPEIPDQEATTSDVSYNLAHNLV